IWSSWWGANEGRPDQDSQRRKPPMKDTQTSAKRTTAIDKGTGRFSEEERAAMKERPRVEGGGHGGRGSAVLAKIAEMPEPDRAMGERLHALIKASAPALSPRLWYGMPAYAKEGKVVCFFQCAQKFKTRSARLGFSNEANLDEGAMWPTAFALMEL